MSEFANSKIKVIFNVLKALAWAGIIFCLFFVLIKNFAPFGALSINYKVTDKPTLVRNFASKEPNKLFGKSNPALTENDFELITTSPLYFDLAVPRAFTKAKVTIKYQDPNNQPEMKLGVKQGNGVYYYADMVMTSPTLDGLPAYWTQISEDSSVLWQKDIAIYDQYLKLKNKLDEELNIQLIDKYGAGFSALDEKQKSNLISSAVSSQDYKAKLSGIYKELEKNKTAVKYSTIGGFQADPPDSDKMLQFNYPMLSNKPLAGYKSSAQPLVFDKSLIGSHEIVTYIGEKEPLNFNFTIQDINQTEGTDDFTVTLYDAIGRKIEEVKSPDAEKPAATGDISPEINVILADNNLPAGVYRLAITDVQDDILIKKITTAQHLIVFKNHIHLAENAEYSKYLGNKQYSQTILFTDSNFIKARASNDSGVQLLQINQQVLPVDIKSFIYQVNITDKPSLSKIISPKNDIYLEGDGNFTFSQEQYFDSGVGEIKDVAETKNINDYDYIIAHYKKPVVNGDWLEASAEVSAPYLYINEGKDKLINFIISLPDLPEKKRILKISEVNIRLEREPFTINNIFSRLKEWIK
ncbi:MAG: hypothetical protein WCV50_00160 [Patescibacteria group bacterium]|jgi:hypothetical protein